MIRPENNGKSRQAPDLNDKAGKLAEKRKEHTMKIDEKMVKQVLIGLAVVILKAALSGLEDIKS